MIGLVRMLSGIRAARAAVSLASGGTSADEVPARVRR